MKTKPLPTPAELHTKLPLTLEQKQFIATTRRQIENILEGTDPRLLLIIGPCSIHDPEAAKQYAAQLKQLAEQTKDTFLIVMRVYFEKSRSALGWKGMLYDPLLDGSHDIELGLETTRKLLLDLCDMEIPTASEMLDPFSINYMQDLLSWGCIGARSATSQVHRLLASGLPMPVGLKNSTDGNIAHAIQAIRVASESHTFIGLNDEGRASAKTTTGNPYAHLVLRGGAAGPNYDPCSVERAQTLLCESDLPEQLIIDCSHGNCSGIFERQKTVFQSVIEQRHLGNTAIRGLILESFLHEGQQKLDLPHLRFGISVTDPCINWAMTEELVLWAENKLNPVESLCTHN